MADPITLEERRPRVGDWYLVAALAIGSSVFAALYDAGGFWPFEVPLWVACTASVAVALPLPWRRLHPSVTAWLISAIYVTAQFLGAMEPGVSQIALFMGTYAIGAWQSDRRSAFLSRLLLCVAIFASLIVGAVIELSNLGSLTVLQYAANSGITVLINIIFFGGAWLFGDRAWNQRLLLAELRRANDEVRRQGRQLADQALDLERVRIARELHDGVAHHIAGVSIHAAAARRSLEKNPARAKESLAVIESSTRETVEELRTLVHTLRDSGSPRAPTTDGAGNPGLGDLPELFDNARRNGQRLEFRTLGEPRPLTPIMELSVYRVIQESLTNCHRYAGADAEVEVRLRYCDAELEVEVSDARRRTASTGHLPETDADATVSHPAPGQETGSAASVGTGLGIIGMRERMSALGGTLEAGPKSRGGWLVRARLPYPLRSGNRSGTVDAIDTPDPSGDPAVDAASAATPDELAPAEVSP